MTQPGDDPAQAKAQARRAAAARRAALATEPGHAARVARAQSQLTLWLAGQGGAALSGYLPIRSEIDPVPVMAGHDGPVGVPLIDGPGLPLRFRVWSPDAVLAPGPFGALVPVEGDELVPRLLIVPLLAWDRRGFRLGYGGGFYDRTLAGLRARGPVTAIGYGFAGQEMPEVPIDAFDQRLDLMATEDGVHPLS
jgi:5-formyltetrahydrofolate cyclo-ligase